MSDLETCRSQVSLESRRCQICSITANGQLIYQYNPNINGIDYLVLFDSETRFMSVIPFPLPSLHFCLIVLLDWIKFHPSPTMVSFCFLAFRLLVAQCWGDRCPPSSPQKSWPMHRTSQYTNLIREVSTGSPFHVLGSMLFGTHPRQ